MVVRGRKGDEAEESGGERSVWVVDREVNEDEEKDPGRHFIRHRRGGGFGD